MLKQCRQNHKAPEKVTTSVQGKLIEFDEVLCVKIM